MGEPGRLGWRRLASDAILCRLSKHAIELLQLCGLGDDRGTEPAKYLANTLDHFLLALIPLLPKGGQVQIALLMYIGSSFSRMCLHQKLSLQAQSPALQVNPVRAFV